MFKWSKKIIVAAVVLCLCLSLSPSALAAAVSPAVSAAASPQASANANEEPDYAKMSWDDIISTLISKYKAAPENIYAGYCNLETGEEYYYEGDESVIAGSMYKVPLNMAISEQMAAGKLDWEKAAPGLSYQDALNETLINSSNEMAMFLWSKLGNYATYRRLIAPYLGVDADNVDNSYFMNNNFSSKQIISCLKYLYANSDSFSPIIDTMKRADQERFFCYEPQEYEVAHKYGYAHDDADIHAYMNDCGIVYADEPFAIVMFTRDAPMPEDLLSAFCAAMSEYTKYHSGAAQRAEEEAAAKAAEEKAAAEKAAAEKAAAEEAARQEAEAAVPSDTPAALPEASATPVKSASSLSVPLLPCVLVVVFLLLAVVLILLAVKKYHTRAFGALLSAIICAVAMLLSVLAESTGTVYAMPTGDPKVVAAEFFEAVKAGDYALASEQLRDYSDLGLGTEPSTEAGRAAYNALRKSYDYELIGEPETTLLNSTQQVRLSYLDLSLIQDDVKRETLDQLEEMVQSLPRNQVYDSNDRYLPEAASEAYAKAVGIVLKDAEKYYTEVEFPLSLSYSGGRWKIVTNPTMLKALNGGTSY